MSVVTLVPTYNQEAYIEDCLNSLLYQNYPDMTVLISDDGSTDSTPGKINRWVRANSRNFKKVDFALHPKNLGALGRRNMQFLRGRIPSDCEYVQILEGDDLLLPTKTLICTDFLNTNKAAGVVHGNFECIMEDGKLHKDGWYLFAAFNIPSGNVFDHFLKNNRLKTCAAMFRREVFLEGFDYDLFGQHDIMLGDYAGTLRIARTHEIHYLGVPLARYRIHAQSLIKNEETKKLAEADTIKIQSLIKEGIL